ncbi:transmembrane 4 L6 family member 19 [Rhineura floridana]|uniref:transmembrane 4 L6 family member 19 n=1 Tax=Rhineura floridana TaxID=261503 RepID=UPI002AC80C6E|nr:transmembrane 4 L6 family member 19 [Rhineura floridana]
MPPVPLICIKAFYFSKGSPSAMCVGTCSRILGLCLLTLGLLSIVANILLLFPSWEWHYLKMGHITKKAMLVPGVWGGGLLVIPAAVQITAVGWKGKNSCSSGTCQKMFLSIVLSGLALLGSAACFILSGVGLTEGPLCLHISTHNEFKMKQWGYPFLKVDNQASNIKTQNYLYDPSVWNSVCIEPQNVVSWNVYFFSALLIISTVEMVLAALQIINGFFGCVCGLCEKK